MLYSVTLCFSISAAKSVLYLQLRVCLRDGAGIMLKYNYGFFLYVFNWILFQLCFCILS